MKSKNKKAITISSIVVLLLVIVGGVIFYNYKDRTLVLSRKGAYDISKKYQTILIKADGITLKNAKAKEIVVHELVADGTVKLTDVKADVLTINGGGVNSVYVKGNSDIGKIDVNRKEKNVHVNIEEQVKLEELNILGGKKVILSGTLDKVNLKADNMKIELNDAVVNKLSLKKSNNTVTVDKNTTVEVLDAKDIRDNEIIVNGEIDKFTIDRNSKNNNIIVNSKINEFKNQATKTDITLKEDSKIEVLRTNAKINVTGTGTIETAVVSNNKLLTGTVEPTNKVVSKDIDSKTELNDKVVNTPVVDTPIKNVGNTITPEEQPSLIVPVTSVKLESNELELFVGDMKTLKVVIAPSNATNKNVTFTSKNNNIASVSSDGVVKALAPGSTEIVVSVDSKTIVCKVVVSPIAVTGVTVNITEDKLVTSEALQLTTTISPSNATNKNVVYKSTDESVATVSIDGNITAVSPGEAEIITTTQDGGKSATTTIVVDKFKTITEVSGEVVTYERELYSNFDEVITALDTLDNAKVVLGEDVELTDTLTLTKTLTVDGRGFSITANHKNNVVFRVDSDKKISFEHVNIHSEKSNNQRAFAVVNTDDLNLNLDRVNIYTTGRGITFDNAFYNGILNIEKSNIYNTRPEVTDYDTTVSIDGGSRGISIWNANNSTLNITDSKILGFGYVIQTSGDKVNGMIDSSNFVTNITNSELKGWGVLCIYESYSTYNIKNSLIRGINTSNGSSNGFSAININYGYTEAKQDIEVRIDGSKIEAYNSGASTEGLFAIPDVNPFKQLVLTNTNFKYASEYSGENNEMIYVTNKQGYYVPISQELHDTIMNVSTITNVTGTNKLGEALTLFNIEPADITSVEEVLIDNIDTVIVEEAILTPEIIVEEEVVVTEMETVEEVVTEIDTTTEDII